MEDKKRREIKEERTAASKLLVLCQDLVQIKMRSSAC